MEKHLLELHRRAKALQELEQVRSDGLHEGMLPKFTGECQMVDCGLLDLRVVQSSARADVVGNHALQREVHRVAVRLALG